MSNLFTYIHLSVYICIYLFLFQTYNTAGVVFCKVGSTRALNSATVLMGVTGRVETSAYFDSKVNVYNIVNETNRYEIVE